MSCFDLPAGALPIEGFKGYFVDRDGNVWSTKRNNGTSGGPLRLLRGELNDGYYRVQVCRPDGQRRFMVHRLVAAAFLGPCPPEMEVAHLNGVRTDNRLSNLQYVTRTENNHHKYGHGTMLMGNLHPRRVIDEATAKAIGVRLQSERSYRRIAAEFGTTEAVVSQIAIGRNWRHVFPADWTPPARRRLSPAQRSEICRLAAIGKRRLEIAAAFGVTRSAISHILKREKERSYG
jgi:hypothetical protein